MTNEEKWHLFKLCASLCLAVQIRNPCMGSENARDRGGAHEKHILPGHCQWRQRTEDPPRPHYVGRQHHTHHQAPSLLYAETHFRSFSVHYSYSLPTYIYTYKDQRSNLCGRR